MKRVGIGEMLTFNWTFTRRNPSRDLPAAFAACGISPRVFLATMSVPNYLLHNDDPDDEDYERDEDEDDVADRDDEGDDFAGRV